VIACFVSIIVSAAPEAPIEIFTDPVLLSRTVCLVIDNAVKYGGTPPVITIKCGRRPDQSVFISVHDNGAGVPEEQREKIFSKYTRFVREDQQNAGTGLGLAISRVIMQLLRGTIHFANHEDGGACFIVSLPSQ
jgi:K+-sensing histidine kinase KdpD